MTDSPYAHYSTPDPEYTALLATFPESEPQDPNDIVAGRQALDAVIAMNREAAQDQLPDPSSYAIVDHRVPVADGTAHILIRTITPTANKPSTFPLLYWTHGGGFIMGTVEMSQDTLTRRSVELQIAVAIVEYRLAPEHPHPIPVTDCFEGLKWVVTNAGSFGADISKGFIIAGDSAGANLTAVVSHLMRDDPFFQGKQPSGQVLQIPCIVDPRSYPEKYKAELRSLDTVQVQGFNKQIICDIYAKHLKNPPEDPTASPLLFSSHADIPPTFFQVAGLDGLRDEGLLYEKVLRETGVKTKLHVYQGLPHGFFLFFPELGASKKFDEDFRDGLVWLLNGHSARPT
ncbi:Alpha/Beta hydrolase protein [Cristinia sonorae]|uniref:Alpha/Beta hydrolase protein n=1 Tax=Cristinia sonorae TaxID=1940300 RepID=A0A8K0XPA5_9AGAR|nr:Alpha/Beta hydrolase protein [Cristinia sonorae]